MRSGGSYRCQVDDRAAPVPPLVCQAGANGAGEFAFGLRSPPRLTTTGHPPAGYENADVGSSLRESAAGGWSFMAQPRSDEDTTTAAVVDVGIDLGFARMLNLSPLAPVPDVCRCAGDTAECGIVSSRYTEITA